MSFMLTFEAEFSSVYLYTVGQAKRGGKTVLWPQSSEIWITSYI